MATLILLLTIAMGAGLQVQAGVNSQLSHYLGSPLRAAAVSFVVGLLGLVVLVALFARSSQTKNLSGAPWWIWFGGFFGAFYVAVAAVAVPRIGAVPLALGVIAGQIAISLALDQYGVIGFHHHAVTLPRLLGSEWSPRG